VAPWAQHRSLRDESEALAQREALEGIIDKRLGY
jgi:hypothetical protein